MAWALTQCDGAATAEAPASPRAQDMAEAADAPEPDRDDAPRALSPEPGERGAFFTLPAGLAPYGALEAGSRVDVLARLPPHAYPYAPRGGVADSWTIVLLQDIAVLDAYDGERGAVTAALEVTPQEHELLVGAQASGELELVTRAPDNRHVEAMVRMSLASALEDLEIFNEIRRQWHRRAKRTKQGCIRSPVAMEDMRVVGVPVALPPAALGALEVGDRVDLTATLEVPERDELAEPTGRQTHATVRLLQGVDILGVSVEQGGVNLEVTLDEALMLSQVQAAGALHVSLRAQGDDARLAPVMRTLGEQLGDLEPLQYDRRERLSKSRE
jgi:Flp pilus assembly protein CpaB